MVDVIHGRENTASDLEFRIHLSFTRGELGLISRLDRFEGLMTTTDPLIV